MENIQTIINKRAEKRLEEDIEKYIEMVHKHPFTDELYEMEGATGVNLRSMFWDRKSTVAQHLRKKMLPDYIKKESATFMATVTELKSKLDAILTPPAEPDLNQKLEISETDGDNYHDLPF